MSLALRRQNGFTLIELLVVITIIGVLASAVLSQLQDSRATARDASNISELRQFQISLEMYRNNNNGQYPCNPTATRVENMNTGCADVTPYIALLPSTAHTQHTGSSGYRYQATTNRSSYTLLVRLYRNDYSWCSISSGTGVPTWNGDPDDGGATDFPPCF